MLRPLSSFSRARTLLQRAGNGNSALADTGEAGVFTPVSTNGVDAPPSDCGGDDPAHIEAALTEISSLDGLEVVAIHRECARSGAHGAWPDQLDHRLVAALEATGRGTPYAHQAEALAALQRREHVVLCTATASGKSLCYQVPIVADALADPNARALMLFPTKALGRDQVESLRA